MDVQVIVFWSRVIAGPLAGVGLLLLVLGLARWRPWREKKFCPGARVVGVRRLSPARVVFTRACGYDLTGLPVGASGEVRCPECGRDLVARRAGLRSAARWRPGRLGAAVMVLAMVVAAAPMLKTRSWQRAVPTTVLIGVKRAVGTERMPTRLRRELDKRIERGGMWAWQRRWVIPALQRDLRADKADRNAYRARKYLSGMGEVGKEALERSLSSRDYQERQLAAVEMQGLCLRRTEKGHERAGEPSELLLRVTVEGLQDDSKLWKSWATYNAYGGAHFLSFFPERTAPFLSEGLASQDRQQRLLCARLVAHGRLRELYDRAIPILVEHVKDNNTLGDAKFSSPALAEIGMDAAGALVQMRSMGDPQQRAVAAALLMRLEPARAAEADRAIYRVLSTSDWSGQAEFGFTYIEGRWGADAR